MSRQFRPLHAAAPGISDAEAYWAIDVAEVISCLPSGVQHMLAGDPARRRGPRAKSPATGAGAVLRAFADAPAGRHAGGAENLLWWP